MDDSSNISDTDMRRMTKAVLIRND